MPGKRTNNKRLDKPIQMDRLNGRMDAIDFKQQSRIAEPMQFVFERLSRTAEQMHFFSQQ